MVRKLFKSYYLIMLYDIKVFLQYIKHCLKIFINFILININLEKIYNLFTFD